jgi:hypothetical protein
LHKRLFFSAFLVDCYIAFIAFELFASFSFAGSSSLFRSFLLVRLYKRFVAPPQHDWLLRFDHHLCPTPCDDTVSFG